MVVTLTVSPGAILPTNVVLWLTRKSLSELVAFRIREVFLLLRAAVSSSEFLI